METYEEIKKRAVKAVWIAKHDLPEDTPEPAIEKEARSLMRLTTGELDDMIATRNNVRNYYVNGQNMTVKTGGRVLDI